MLWFIIFCIAPAILCSYVAGQKNRNKVSWFFSGLLFSIFAIVAVVAVPSLGNEVEDVEKQLLKTWSRKMNEDTTRTEANELRAALKVQKEKRQRDRKENKDC